MLYLQVSLALENVEVLITSGAIQAYVPAADILKKFYLFVTTYFKNIILNHFCFLICSECDQMLNKNSPIISKSCPKSSH